MTVSVAGVFDEGGATSSPSPLSVMRLADMQALLGEQGNVNYVFISNEGGAISGARHTEAVLDAFEDLRDERGLDYDDVKRDGLDEADTAGDQFASIFLLFGTFSIMAGILLIALIFVMLAAERKRELGIARAVGAQRGDIVRLFTFEGAVYSLAAAAVGSVLGIVVGLVMVRIIAAALGAVDDFDGFEIVFRVPLAEPAAGVHAGDGGHLPRGDCLGCARERLEHRARRSRHTGNRPARAVA